MARRWRIGLLIAGLGLLLLAVGAAGAGIRWNGSLGYGYSGGVGVPVQMHRPFSIGMGELRPTREIRIESVRLHGASGGVRLVGVLAYPFGHQSVGTDRGFPPASQGGGQPAVGLVVPAHGRFSLVVGLEAVGLGDFSVHGVDVLYREHWHGLTLRRRAHTGVEVEGCAVDPKPGLPRCATPTIGGER